MSISTRIAAPHGAVFLVVGAFKSSALFAPTRRPHAPIGETLAAPESGATWAKRARDAGKRAVPSSKWLFTDQVARCSLHATRRKFLLYAKAARRATRLLSNPAGSCLYDVAPDDGALLTCT